MLLVPENLEYIYTFRDELRSAISEYVKKNYEQLRQLEIKVKIFLNEILPDKPVVDALLTLYIIQRCILRAIYEISGDFVHSTLSVVCISEMAISDEIQKFMEGKKWITV